MQTSIATALSRQYGNNPNALNFAAKLVNFMVSNKYIKAGSKAFHKQRSLSIGDKIATSAANLHRDICFEHVPVPAYEAGLLIGHFAFVDDTASF